MTTKRLALAALLLAASTATADDIQFLGGSFVYNDAGNWDNLDGLDRVPGIGDTARFEFNTFPYNFFINASPTVETIRWVQSVGSSWFPLPSDSDRTITATVFVASGGGTLQVQAIDLDVGGLAAVGGSTLDLNGSQVVCNAMSVGGTPSPGLTGAGFIVVRGAGSHVAPVNASAIFDQGAIHFINGATATLSNGIIVHDGTLRADTGAHIAIEGSPSLSLEIGTSGSVGDVGRLEVFGTDTLVSLLDGTLTIGEAGGSAGETLIDTGGTITVDHNSEVLVDPTGTLTLEPSGNLVLGSGLLTVAGGTVDAVDAVIEFGVSGDLVVCSDGVWEGPLQVTGGVSTSVRPRVRIIEGSTAGALGFTQLTVGQVAGEFGFAEVSGVDGVPSTLRAASQLVVGGFGHGELLVRDGGRVNVPSGDFIVGDDPGGTGVATVTTADSGVNPGVVAGSDAIVGNVFVGSSDTTTSGVGTSGTLTVEDGGFVTATGDVAVATLPGSSGSITVASAASVDTARIGAGSDVLVGGDEAAVGGVGSLFIGAGGEVSAFDELRIWDTSVVDLEGGTIYANRVTNRGQLRGQGAIEQTFPIYFACGSGGDCFTGHAGPGCDDAVCCGAVCVEDPTCCSSSWDATCALLAGQVCPPATGTPIALRNEGTLAVDAEITVNGAFEQTPTGGLELDIAGASPVPEFDRLSVTSTALLDGTLALTVDPGLDADLGTIMDVLVADAVSGSFATVETSPNIEITILADRVRARVVGGPPVADYNLDIGQPDFGNPPYDPSDDYAAAAGQPGFWQSFGSLISTSPRLLLDVNARDNGMTMTSSDVTFTVNANNLATIGDDFLLLDDFLPVASTPHELTFAGLPPGRYRVTTYAWDGTDPSQITTVDVPGSCEGPLTAGGPWPGTLAEGITHVVHEIETADGTIVVRASAATGTGAVNGVQITAIASCPADTDCTGNVGVDDLVAVITDWGTDGSANGGDVTGAIPGSPPDGIVDVNDLNAVITAWGVCE